MSVIIEDRENYLNVYRSDTGIQFKRFINIIVLGLFLYLDVDSQRSQQKSALRS